MKEVIAVSLVIVGIYVGGCAIIAGAFTVGVALPHTHPKRKRKK